MTHSSNDNPIGASLPRANAKRLLAGRGQYVDDLQFPRMLHAAVLRSPHAHARITRLTIDAAQRAPGVVRVITGADVAALCKPYVGVLKHIKGMQSAPQLPQVPTFIEAGLPGFDSAAWYGPVVPAGTPRAIITRLHAAVAETLKSSEVTERLTNVSTGYIVGSSPEEYAAFIQTERAKWAKVIRQTGVKLAL